MKFQNKLTVDEYINAMYFHLYGRTRFLRIFWPCVFVAGFLAAVGIIVDVAVYRENPSIGVWCVTTWALFCFYYFRFRYKALLKESFEKLPGLSDTYEYTIGEEGISYSSETSGHGKYLQKDIQKWYENKELFLLYLGKVVILMISKRSLDSKEKMDAFRNFLQKIPE